MAMIAIDFDGYVYVNPEDISFVYIGKEEEKKQYITGNEYILLSKQEKKWYILEDLGKVINESMNVCWGEINVEVEND